MLPRTEPFIHFYQSLFPSFFSPQQTSYFVLVNFVTVLDKMHWSLKDLLIVAVVWTVRVGVTGGDDCSYPSLTSLLQNLTSQFPLISRLDSIGQTEDGRELWVIVITDAPGMRPLLRPQVKFVGNINGKSASACEVLLKLASHLLQAYEHEDSLERILIQTVEIHILPNLNPDGISKSKSNLNRDFPDIFGQESSLPPNRPETRAVIHWIHDNNFVLSASLISGMYVICIPFDNIPSDNSNTLTHEEHLTPDNDIFTYLASAYWNNTYPRPDHWQCPQLDVSFPGGIINGAAWYPSRGTMMDYNYFFGVFELMVGLSCSDSEAENVWLHHKPALLYFISQANTGVKGQVIDKLTKAPIRLPLITKLHDHYPKPWPTSMYGEFWRPLAPGLYAINVSAEGYVNTYVHFEIRDGMEPAVTLEVELVPHLEARPYDRSTESEVYSSTSGTPLSTVDSQVQTISTTESGGGVVHNTETNSINETRAFHRVIHNMLVQLVSSSPKHNELFTALLIASLAITMAFL